MTQILTEITADWDVGVISAETRLGNLGLESVALVYFIAEVQQHYALQTALFNELKADGRLLTGLCVSDIVELVDRLIAGVRTGQD